MIRTMLRAAMLGLLVLASEAAAGENRAAILYKDPLCGCCEDYADYLRQNGYDVKVVATHDVLLIKQTHGVPAGLEGCHTTLVDDYVVEGHVPVSTMSRLLTEKPSITGISLPGMPPGSPGMSGDKTGPLTVYGFGKGTPEIYAVE